MKSLIVLLVCVLAANAVEFRIRNNLPGAIWVGILGNADKPPLANGGFVLQAFEETSVFSDDQWAGRFWARTYCHPDTQYCETGDCGNKLECNGAGGRPPVSLAEITLRGHAGLDFYDISLVDGFNVAASIGPIGGSGDCYSVACPVDVNPNCPYDLRLIGSNGLTIACHSACDKYNTDQYCCRGDYGTPETCDPNTWGEHNSAAYFKAHCPDAYSYAYDDQTSTFTCVSDIYQVTFG